MLQSLPVHAMTFQQYEYLKVNLLKAVFRQNIKLKKVKYHFVVQNAILHCANSSFLKDAPVQHDQ